MKTKTATIPISDELLDATFPSQGLCAFCGLADARHRIIDRIADRHRAGESVRELAFDYDLPESSINIAIRYTTEQKEAKSSKRKR